MYIEIYYLYKKVESLYRNIMKLGLRLRDAVAHCPIHVFVLTIFSVVLACSGGRCGRSQEASEKQGIPQQAAIKSSATNKPKAKMGSIQGRVMLKLGDSLPKMQLAKLADNLPNCDAGTLAAQQRLKLVEDRGLQGVLIALSNFKSVPQGASKTHQLVAGVCGLHPQFVAATKGDSLVIQNQLNTPLVPLIGESQFAQVVTAKKSRRWELEKAGRFQVACKYGQPCGQTSLAVLHHNLHRLSDEDGRFRIDDVPVGDTVQVHAWHPKLGTVQAVVSVREGKSVNVQLALGRAKKSPGKEKAAGPS